MGRLRKEKVTAEHSDILISYNNVRHRKWKICNLSQLLIEPSVIAHIASVLTIISMLPSQFKSGSWNLFIIIAGIIWIISGIYSMRYLFNTRRVAVVNYMELHDLLTVARYEAERSIITIGGDLSWLKKDIKTLREIKEEHPHIHIYIYYEKDKLSRDTKELVETLECESSIKLIPYPVNMPVPLIRCMVTDYDLKENGNCKIYTYPKVKWDNTSNHEKDKFLWNEYTYQTNPNLYNAVVSLLESLNAAPLHQVFVGISGINNTGKTSIINKCKEILDDNFTVRVIPDIFVGKDLKGDYSRENRQILLRQGEDLCEKYTEQIIIFDRTPFDNLMYLMMREMMKSKYRRDNSQIKMELYMEYNRFIVTQMEKFDLLYYIQRINELSARATKKVSLKERNCVRNLYNEYWDNFFPRDTRTFKIGDLYEEDIEKAATELAADIRHYYYTGKRVNDM